MRLTVLPLKVSSPLASAAKRRLKEIVFRAKTAAFYSRKLFRGLAALNAEPLDGLRDIERIEELISAIGLAHDRRGLYGADIRHMNRFGQGLWQIPRQLATALTFLSHQRIR